MSFLIEKYKPQTINDFLFNVSILEQLMHIASHDDIPHIIISGPHGGGKKTLVNFFLEAIYDSDINILSKCKYNVNGSSTKKVIEILQSNYHIVIEPTNTNHDKYILQEIIKQYAQHRTFNLFKTRRNFKMIVILNIENLSNNSQAALRRTMELYARSCRFVMICNNLSKIFDPLKSRCRIFSVPLPKQIDIDNMLTHISVVENIQLSQTEKKNIIEYSGTELKKAIWALDAKKINIAPTITLDTIFENIIYLLLSSSITASKDIIKAIFKKIRENIYSILITNIDGSKIITTILDKMIHIVKNDEISISMIKIASYSEYNLIHGRRDIINIDTFIGQIMQVCIKNKDKLKHIEYPVCAKTPIPPKSKVNTKANTKVKSKVNTVKTKPTIKSKAVCKKKFSGSKTNQNKSK